MPKFDRASFDSLPTEVQFKILSDTDVTTLRMISLVNKSLRCLVADVLFGYISIDSTSGMQPGQSYFKLTRKSVRWVASLRQYL